MADITLQRILVPYEKAYDPCPGLFYRTSAMGIPHPGIVRNVAHMANIYPSTPLSISQMELAPVTVDADRQALTIEAGATASLCTYFNMLSLGKWRRYTCVDDFAVTLELEGAGELVIYEFRAPDALRNPIYLYYAEAEEAGRFDFYCPTRQEVTIKIPSSKATCVGFDIIAANDVALYGGRYHATAPDEALNPVDICLLTTTFNKEEFITANIRMLREQVWGGDDELAEHLDVFVVDNGQTLDAADIEGEHARLFPNKNVGGAGGFARGMIEALRSGKTYTHALIMDDDVSMHPEAFRRTYTLLRTLKPEHTSSYISGAMMRLNEMNIQHEDVGYVDPGGYFAPRKGVRDMYDIRNIVYNEAYWAPLKNQYAAWWYCCIPMRYIREDSLPLPVFVRGDDVEFSLRNKPSIISLAGICVWHMGFNKKFSASMEYYQVIRNSLVLQASTGTAGSVAFFRQAYELVLFNLYQYAYDYADLVLDALEDFMRGPKFLEEAEGIALVKEKGVVNEKMKPLEDFVGIDVDFDLTNDEHLQRVRVDWQVETPRRAMRMFTINGHRRAPKSFYREGVGSTPHDWGFTTGKQTGYEEILAINPDEHTATMRKRDMVRYEQVMTRLKRVSRTYRLHHRSIERSWRKSYPYLTSKAFWMKFLGLED